MRARALCTALALGWAAAPAPRAAAEATIMIENLDGPGEGFNDPKPVTAVGGNSATTLGAQRLRAVQHAADLWGKALDSDVPIRIGAKFEPIGCDATIGI